MQITSIIFAKLHEIDTNTILFMDLWVCGFKGVKIYFASWHFGAWFNLVCCCIFLPTDM